MIDRASWRDDSGQVAGIEVLPFGFLIFVVGTLLLANAWAVVDAKMAATVAAREGSRTAVEAVDGTAARAEAAVAARAALIGQGRADEATVDMRTDGAWGRCRLVTVEVQLTVPAIGLPFIGGFGQNFEVTAHHSEIVDPYRSGLPGEADCD
jgi:hypothetical protein